MATIFDGKTMTIVANSKNIYLEVPTSGTVDHLVDVLQNQYYRPLPAADLPLTNSYAELMTDVNEEKDLGSGVIGGLECDHLAFPRQGDRLPDLDGPGRRPFPCKYVIISKLVAGYPAYTFQFADWQSGGAAVEGHLP